MKNTVGEFIRRGLTACGFGPLILVAVYLVLQDQCDLQMVTVKEVCVGIVSLSVLAFIAGGMNILYQIERLPLTLAILIHGSVLYVSYLMTYLVNGWLERGMTPMLVFTGIFVLGYIAVWTIIFRTNKRRTSRLNAILQTKQGTQEDMPH